MATNNKQTVYDLFILQRIDFQNTMVRTQHWQSCLNCVHFKLEKEECDLFKARPPAHIIVSACKDYLDDIPF